VKVVEMRPSHGARTWLTPFGTAVPMIVLPVAILTIPLAAASQMRLSSQELSSWLLTLYGIPGALSIFLAHRYQQPLLLTGNVFILIFFTSLEGQHRYSALVGAAMLAGLAVVIISAVGLTDRLSRLIPPPIVLGLLTGAVLPYVADVFTMLEDEPFLVGGTILAYLLGQRTLGTRLTPILPALIAGISITAITGKIGGVPADLPAPSLVMIRPTLTLEAAISVTPVLVILLTLQSNVPSIVFLRTQDYHPPEHQLNMISGWGTAIGSLFGPTGISLSLPATSIVGGPDAGDVRYRHRAVYISGGAVLVVAALSGSAALLTTIIPMVLLLTLAGLAVVGVLAHALQQITRGPLTLGPLFAFATSLSEISLLGFGSFFWGLVIGSGVSLLIERDALREMHEPTT
jgi:benzoate membrane transport protein